MPDNSRWKRRPAGSTWGDWGPDDELGRLNLLTPAKVKEGVAEVREGKAFCLSLPLDYPGGTVVNARRHPPRLIANSRCATPGQRPTAYRGSVRTRRFVRAASTAQPTAQTTGFARTCADVRRRWPELTVEATPSSS